MTNARRLLTQFTVHRDGEIIPLPPIDFKQRDYVNVVAKYSRGATRFRVDTKIGYPEDFQ